ncbi:MAG: NUDIX hydrolase [Acidobacteria bacterium]|nr:NUDIX hydrolase [Acidobacteriota bacterium]
MKIVQSEEVLKTRIFRVMHEVAEEPGFRIDRSVVLHPGSAVMMAVDDDGRVLLVRQYRVPARDYLWELPAGKIDPGESPLEAARRELEEETGLRADSWTQLSEFYPTPGYVSEKMHLYLARGLTQHTPRPMDDERIESRWFTTDELDSQIRDGSIEDGKTILGYLLWRSLTPGS